MSSDLKQAVVAAHQSEKSYGVFQNILKSIILQRDRLLITRKYSGWLEFFPGVGFPANSPQGQIVQCSEKLQKAQELHLRP